MKLLWLLAGALWLSTALSAQVLLTVDAGVPPRNNPDFATASGGLKLGIALPSAPHTLVLWNAAGLSFDRLPRNGVGSPAVNGGSLETGLEGWLSPAAHPSQSHAPLLLVEAAVGRRWGSGRHGFSSLGAGVGWSLGDWVPYVEYRRRAGFHPASPIDRQVVVGLHFVLFG